MTGRILLSGRSEMLKPIITELLAFRQIIDEKDVGIIYESIDHRNTVKRVGKPRIFLVFKEDTDFKKTGSRSTVPHGRRLDTAIISFRLMDETTKSFTEANGKALGTKIKQAFGAGDGFIWNKGRTLYSYTEWEKGYQLQLLCKTKSEAKRITTAVLSLKSDAPDWRFLQEVQSDQEVEKYPANPGTDIIMGETIDKPNLRPVIDVRFQYAYAKLDGLKEPVTLYDRTGKRVRALVK